ncbi:MAG TPA: hypothetical protein DCY13_23395 [Verrucomicrobiales bacterium]|nr:hypothetical protein [Verrucomicrobiales bacterium]
MHPDFHPAIDCPVCVQPMTPLAVGRIVVDVCHDGCGGVWFDHFELQKLDEQHETEGDLLAHVGKHPDIARDPVVRLNCPRCADVVLRQHFFCANRKVEVDSCPACGGYWLDHGELGRIRAEFDTAAARALATEEFVRDLDNLHVKEACSRALDKAAQSRSLSAMFRLVGSRYV